MIEPNVSGFNEDDYETLKSQVKPIVQLKPIINVKDQNCKFFHNKILCSIN